MTIQSYEQRVLIPENGKFLYNANADDWKEITAEDKARIEADWEAE